MKKRDEVLTGLLLAVALVIGVAGTIWLVRGGFRSGYALYSIFRWGTNLKVGQAVRLAGVQVGYVGDVQLRDNGTLLVEMKIEDAYRIPAGATAVVTPVGIFGDAEVSLLAQPGTRKIAEGDTIPAGTAPAGIAEVTAKADSVATIAVDVSRRVQQDFFAAGGMVDLRRAIGQTNELLVQLSGIAAEQSRQLARTQATLRRTLASVDSAQVDSTVRNVNATSANLAALSDSLRRTTATLNATLARLERGEGTAGKLLTDTVLYSRVNTLLLRVDSLTVDFKKNPRKYINLEIF